MLWHEVSSICSIYDTYIVLFLHKLWCVPLIGRLVQGIAICSTNSRTGLDQLACRSTTFASYSIVVLDPGVLQLSDLMELFEGNELLLEVFSVEVIIVVEAKDSIVFQFLLEELANLGCC